MGVYFALLEPGDTILGMDLAHGGHLTHGALVSFSGRFFNFAHYGVKKETGMIDYDQAEELAKTHRPKMIVAGASAYPRIIDFPKFAKIAESVGAWFMVDMAHIAGLVAANVHPSPVPFADVVTSTTHKTLRGARGGLILATSEAGVKIDKQIFPGIQGGPLMHIIAGKAIAFKEAMTDSFQTYQENIVKNARALAKYLLDHGIDLVSGGTDNHMVLLDLRNLDITGKDAADKLELAGITANKNAVPFDEQPRTVTSGIRLGTPAITTRGMGETEMEIVGEVVVDVLKNIGQESAIQRARQKTLALCERFPIYR
jgi:glycine hydroxymethyltransferase